MIALALRHISLLIFVVAMTAIGTDVGNTPSTSNADFSKVPGIVIAHQAASTAQYIGSPAIAILPNGSYAASHDFFGPGTQFNRTHVYSSRDKGVTWKKISEIEGQFWSSLFFHRGALYLMGTTREYGLAIIRRSTDFGVTWTTPRDGKTGLLLAEGEYHCAPVPILFHAGRLWRAMEDRNPPLEWGVNFRAFMMSAPEDSDLLQATNWLSSNRLRYDPAWGGRAWLEGNAVLTPEKRIVDVLRNDYRPDERVAIVDVSDDGHDASFQPETGFTAFPGGAKKFAIRFDPQTKCYWTLSNYIPPAHRNVSAEKARNTVALLRSPDLKNWEVPCVILYHPDPQRHGFQYLDWQFEGEDLIAACRTAFNDGLGGAHNQHDANFLTFHRVKMFRKLSWSDSPAEFLKIAEHP